MKIFKRVPSKNYESSYDYSDNLIEHIAKDSREEWSSVVGVSGIGLALILGAGKTFYMGSPFTLDSRAVEWTLEEE